MKQYPSPSFTVAWNDGTPHRTILLFAFKRVISQQLPMMPVDYILRILMDRAHRCVLAIELPDSSDNPSEEEKCKLLENAKVMGGICFRPFQTQGFAEIVFLAVEESNKHKGLGTLIMNHCKEHVKTEQIKFFLTYADNTAIGYFVKQGFTKKKSMVRARWEGYIKDYVRSTLMECKILYNVNYITFKKTLSLQRQKVSERIIKISKSHIVRPGLDPDREYKIEEIPGVLEAGWNPESASNSTRRWGIDASLTAQLGQVLKVIKSMKQSWPFTRPVDPLEAPGYFDVIKRPMDLSTMEKKLNDGLYVTKDLFIEDFNLMITNCQSYNDTSTIYVQCANALHAKFNSLMKRL